MRRCEAARRPDFGCGEIQLKSMIFSLETIRFRIKPPEKLQGNAGRSHTAQCSRLRDAVEGDARMTDDNRQLFSRIGMLRQSTDILLHELSVQNGD